MSAVLSNRPTVPDKRCTIRPVFTAGNVIWKKVVKETPNPSVTIPVDKAKARFVKIQLNGKGALTLAEVIVK